jgi:hypothetical protein
MPGSPTNSEEFPGFVGKAKGAIDGHDRIHHVRPFGGKTRSDLPTHRVPYDDEFLARIFGRHQRLDVGDVIVRHVGTRRHDLRSAMPPQIDGDDTILVLKQRRLPAPIVGIARPTVQKHHVLAVSGIRHEELRRRLCCSVDWALPLCEHQGGGLSFRQPVPAGKIMLIGFHF